MDEPARQSASTGEPPDPLEAEVDELRRTLERRRAEPRRSAFVAGLLRGLGVVVILGVLGWLALRILLWNFQMPGG